MKTNDFEPITRAIRDLLAGTLGNPDALHLAEPGATVGKMPHGFHSHDAWELFCPLRASLQFVLAGRPPTVIPAHHLLIVPPGQLHLSVDRLDQPKALRLLVMNLPGTENPYGGLRIGNNRERSGTTLSPDELAAWTTAVGTDPGVMMDQVARSLAAGVWGRERALGLIRILVASFAEVISHPRQDRTTLDARRVAEVQLFLQSHYFEPDLSVKTVAQALGMSASHLGALFRKTMGRTLHQTLLNLRLSRATDLLTRTTLSVKEIAAMTGWSNQLYFSAAYRRRYGRPPTAVRSAASEKAESIDARFS